MVDIRNLTRADLPGALRLSTEARWNQLEQDWRRLLTLWPQSCLGGFLGPQLVATATVAIYDTVGWIGMILVDESRRGQGLGGLMFERVMDVARGVGATRLGLDATDLGRPVYLKRGFTDHSRIARWIGQGRTGTRDASAHRLLAHHWPAVLELDRRATGVDRSVLLRALADEPGAAGYVTEDSTGVTGAGFVRPGRTASHVGPVSAESPASASALLTALLAHVSGQVMIDIPEGSALSDPLSASGFKVARRLTRMANPRAAGPLITGPMVYAAAGFELG